MVHILLFVLKIIGWILLAILALFVLLVCVMLLTPLRYFVSGSCGGSLESLQINARFSFLLHLIRGSVQYENEALAWEMSIGWRRFGKKGEEKESVAEKPDEQKQKLPVKDTSSGGRTAEESKECPEKCTDRESGEHTGKCTAAESGKRTGKCTDRESGGQTAGASGSEKIQEDTCTDKLSMRFQRITCTFQTFCDKIKALLRKKEILTAFITDEIHKAAFFKLLEQFQKFLRRMKPKEFRINVHFGFGNPSYTGILLAGISMLYPIFGEHAEIEPDFEQEVLEGNMFLKGRIQFWIAAAAAFNLLCSKEVRATVRHIKKFSFD